MAVLETIRVKIGWLITALIAIALLSFIVDFNSLSSAVSTSSDKYTVGKINGKKVSYKDFQEQVEYQTRISEIVGANANADENQQRIRQSAWQHFIDESLFLKKAKAAGIAVGKDEMVDLTSGDMLSPVMAYDPIFGGNGNFDKESLKNFLDNIDNDPSGNSRAYWTYLQNAVMTQQYYAKYGSLFTASALPNALSVKSEMDGNNFSANLRAVSVQLPVAMDSTISVSSSEIKKYYNSHKDQYKQVDNRDIVYALFEVEPSEADYEAARTSLEEVYEEFAATDNVKNFLMRNSERSFSTYFYKNGELKSISKDIDDFVFGGKSGVSPIVKNGESYYAARVVKTRNVPDSVFVRHILIQGDNALADSLFNVVKAKPAQFSQVAALYSADKNPNVAKPGDLGWMTQSYMIPGMEAVMTASVGKIFTIDTSYGRHIVEVTKTTKPLAKKQVAILQKTAVPSKATMNDYYNRANTLATRAQGRLDSLQAAAKDMAIYLRPMNITDATARYGAADKAKEVTRWAFDNKVGKASSVITVNQNYLFVVGIKAAEKEGYKSVENVSASIRSFLYNEKLQDKVAAEVAAKIAGLGTIEEVAAALDSEVEAFNDVTFSSTGMYNATDPALAGISASAEIGKICGPVKGQRAIYVACVDSRNEGAHFTEEDAVAAENRKLSYMTQMVIPTMLEQTGSVDHREKFY